MQVIKAYAKINLGLKVIGKRKDGYHNLDMLMATIDLYDILYVEKKEENITLIEMSEEVCDMTNNICYKLIEKIKKTYNITNGIKVVIQKNIPSGAGLGGGSADAAALLCYLNKEWKLGMSIQDMINFAEEIGSDIPFCIVKRFSRVREKGKTVNTLSIYDAILDKALIIIPDVKLSTKNVFNEYKKTDKKSGSIARIIKKIKKHENNLRVINDLEASANRLSNGLIEKIIQECKEMGLMNTFMTGSGSGIVALTFDQQQMEKIKDYLENKYNNIKIIYTNLKMYTC